MGPSTFVSPTDTEIRCALCWALVRRHGWRRYISRDDLIAFASIPTHAEGDAKAVLRDLRTESFIDYDRTRGVTIDSSRQGELAEFLIENCGYSRFRVESSLKHYEGFES